MSIENLFLELIQVAVGNRETLSRTPSADEWKEIFSLSKTQAVAGVCFAAVQRLKPYDGATGSPTENLPETLKLQWLGMVAKVQQKVRVHQEVIGRVSALLEAKGIDAVFMKGLICGSRYKINDALRYDDDNDDTLHPTPYTLHLADLRQPGDIDFVVRKEDFARTLDALEEIGEVDRGLVHEHHGMAHVSGVQLEPHYKLHNFQHPGVDRFAKGLQEWLFADKERVRKVRIGVCEIPAMPLELEGVFLVSHMVNHVYEEGLGLRQVMDYAMWLMHIDDNDNDNNNDNDNPSLREPQGKLSSGQAHDDNFSANTNRTKNTNPVRDFDWKLHDEWLKGMRMTRAHRVFVRMCEEYLGVPTNICGYRYTEGEKRFADKLMGDILRVGNFGRGAYVFDHSSRWGELKNYLWVCQRAVRLHYLCPAEAWMWPVSKVVRWFGKKLKSGR